MFLRDEAAALGLKMVAILVSVRDRLRDPAVQKLKGRGVDGGGQPPLGRWMDWPVGEERKEEAKVERGEAAGVFWAI